MIWLIVGFIVIIGFIILEIFTSKKLSPIPYFPSNHRDKNLIFSHITLKNDQIFIDAGAGDGWIIFESAHITFEKGLNTVFVAIEINPILIGILHIKRFFHPNRKQIIISSQDMFSLDWDQYKQYKYHTLYVYISPWFVERVIKKARTILSDLSIISYYYPIPYLKDQEKKYKGIHDLYTYNPKK
ncbi:MAG: hypothetical protein WCO06_00035 [Candidatus Roizmanbacteria bacterium]